MNVHVTKAWDELEGQTIDGRFVLRRYVGAGERSAVFITAYNNTAQQRAAIKLALADDAEAEELLARWRRASQFFHPHLIRILETGRAIVSGSPVIYSVQEYADEDLSQVGRPLS